MEKSASYAKFLEAKPHTIQTTIGESIDLAHDMAAEIGQLDPAPDMIVGLANGAFLPAKVVGETLQLPWHMVKVRRKGTRYKQRLGKVVRALRIPPQLILWGPLRAMWVLFQNGTRKLEESEEKLDFDPAGKHIVLVDDAIETGNSFRHVTAMMVAAGAASVRTAAYCWADMPKIPDEQSRPTIYLHREIQVYPWSNNSTHVGAFESWLSENGITLWT